MTQFVTIDRTKRLKEQPESGHNRWHPDIPPIIEVEQHENVVMETRDASDGQVTRETTESDFEMMDQKVSHPLTGPVYVKGAEPGDLLEVEYVEIYAPALRLDAIQAGSRVSQGHIRSAIRGSLGHRTRLRDIQTRFGVCASRTGRSWVQPGWPPRASSWMPGRAGRTICSKRGGFVLPPDIEDAVPGGRDRRGGASHRASEGERGQPGREAANSRLQGLYIPVAVEGALYSVGDGHFAQGDGEVCITAIEMGATVGVRFSVHKGEAERKRIRTPRFSHPGYFLPPESSVPRNFIGDGRLPDS